MSKIKNPRQVLAFIQARMSSRRFPGKVLAKLKGKPVLDHIFSAVSQALGPDNIVLLTSDQPSDDPLAQYADSRNLQVFRGSLENVFNRFRECLETYPCDWILRVCADSPFLDPALLRTGVKAAEKMDCDIITNIFPRTFPKGQSFEVILAEALRAIDMSEMSDDEKEHVTPFFYNHPERFRIKNISCSPSASLHPGYAIDTPEDLLRLEAEAHPTEFMSGVNLEVALGTEQTKRQPIGQLP